MLLATAAYCQQTETRDPLSQFSDSLASLAHRIAPAVVQIVNAGYVSDKDDDDDANASYTKGEMIGSGVIVAADGYIITNAHVIKGAKRIRVILNPASAVSASAVLGDSPTPYDATIVGVHQDTDLALVKINADHLPTIPLAEYADLRQGQLVIAVGNPMGLKNAVSIGIISSVARQPEQNEPVVLIQTDAAINPGNSGGALVDTQGRLVGITTETMGERLGFAVPSDVVKSVYQQLRQYGSVRRGDIGVELQNVSSVIARGLSLSSVTGVLVAGVKPNSPAQKTGLKPCDVIVSVDGKGVGSVPEFESAMYFKREKELVRLEVLRNHEKLLLSVPVAARVAQSADPLLGNDPDKELIRRLGVFVADISKDDRDQKEFRERSGANVIAKMAADQMLDCDLKPGDVIHSVNGRTVFNVDSLRHAIEKLGSGDPVAVLIERSQKYLFVGCDGD